MKLRILFLLAAVTWGCAAPERRDERRPGRRAEPRPTGQVLRGKASFYARRFHGRKTASGERFSIHGMTGAHRSLPFGTRVKVTNLKNGRAVVVRINDRGPYGRGRVIDLSPAAARQIDMIQAGVVPVTVEILSRP
jgi:rare lipoprotein A